MPRFPVIATINVSGLSSLAGFGLTAYGRFWVTIEAYRLFSTKSYVVMPRTMSAEDSDRMDSLCMLFGVGLVVFDLNVALPNFEARVRAQRFPLDMFYVNEFADRLKLHNGEVFEELFR